MKRTIAITLAVLTILVCLAGCSRRTGNVADNKDGMLTGQEDRAAGNNGVMDDMKDAVRDTGDAIGDVGRAVGDAVTGHDSTSGTGMTGSR